MGDRKMKKSSCGVRDMGVGLVSLAEPLLARDSRLAE
jgi:hypothetical protein